MTSPDEEAKLFLEIGTAITENTLGLKPRSDEEVTNIGRRWFNASLTTMKTHICSDATRARLNKAKDPSELLVALADVLIACAFPSHIPIMTVARLCIIVGVNSICDTTE